VPRLADAIMARLPQGGSVGILGLSYKPNTEVIEESQGVGLARHLLGLGVRVVVYDPAAMPNARALLNGSVEFAASAAECAGQCHVVAITTAWDEFKKLGAAEFMPAATVLDCWRILSRDSMGSDMTLLYLGSGIAELPPVAVAG